MTSFAKIAVIIVSLCIVGTMGEYSTDFYIRIHFLGNKCYGGYAETYDKSGGIFEKDENCGSDFPVCGKATCTIGKNRP